MNPMNRADSAPESYSPAHRRRIGLHVGLSVAALLAIVLMGNYLAARHFRRFEWAHDARFQLSPQTQRVLASVTNDVRVTLLYERSDALFSAVSGLLREYAYACTRIVLEHVDYTRDLGRAQLIIAKHQLPAAASDQVIFEANGRARVIGSAELSEYNIAGLLAGEREVRRVAFRGESLFTAAIASLLEASPLKAYWLQGHGEHDLTSDESLMGYAKFARLLQQKNIHLAPLTLLGGGGIPEDCQLLIVAGPQGRLEAAELERIQRFLAQGGRLLALLSYYRSRNTPIGLERFLADWGVAVGANFAYDPAHTLTGNDLVSTNFTGHAVLKPLLGQSLYLVLPRSVEPLSGAAPSPDAPQAQVLFATSDSGYTASELTPAGVPKPNPLWDRRGAIPLAVAVEKGSIQGVRADRGSSRLVVVGESVFLANQTIEKLSNFQFASLAVSWLLDQPGAVAGIAPRPVREYRLTLTRRELFHVQLILLVALPGAVVLLGTLVWMRRRS
ncbi:MAG: hypothetical protein FJ387_05595 [Verrucomicrobia bacterium]|nr:hypothetical protein [Verrucomicrobiota bacterium]